MNRSNNLNLKQVKTITTFIFLGLYLICSTATSQLIDYDSKSYSLKKIEYVRECVLSNHLSKDTLTIELLSRNMQFSQKPDLDFIVKNDTLNITVKPKIRQKKMLSSIYVDELAPKGKIETFRFKGFKKCPATIYLNGIYYKKCPTEDIESKIYNGNIINKINKNGFKEGAWLQFYETGELREKKYYENGRLLNGKTFDRNGKDLHYISESSGSITSLQTDSLFNK